MIAKFLSRTAVEWSRVHENGEADLLTSITNQIVSKLLPENQNQLNQMFLTSLLSENALTAVVEYLSDQESLMRLVINVLSNDSDRLLKSAQVESADVSTPSTSPAESRILSCEGHPNCELASSELLVCRPLQVEPKILSQTLQATKPPENLEEYENLSPVGTHSDQSHLSAVSPANHELSTETDGDGQTDEFVSDDINKFFKLAPPTPVKDMLPTRFAASSLFPATFTADPDCDATISVDSKTCTVNRAAVSTHRECDSMDGDSDTLSGHSAVSKEHVQQSTTWFNVEEQDSCEEVQSSG